MSIKRLSSVLLALTIAVAPSRALAQGDTPPGHLGSITELLRYEPTGLSLMSPYARGKIPVLFIHGMCAHPASWHRMIATLENDPAIRERYQFWTFGYSTGDPIPYSAHLLRRDLEVARRKLDPGRSDAALDRIVIVGHSMGGLLTKMMVADAGDRLWRAISDRPFGELSGEKEDLALIRECTSFGARPEVRRVVYIATPHRGSPFDRGAIHHLGDRLVRIADPLKAAHHRLVSRNGPTFFRDFFRTAIPTSVDELEPGSPFLACIAELPTAPVVKAHSIIAVLPAAPPTDRTDGLVQYASAHLADAASEKVVAAGHLCQGHPDVIAEVRRILTEHAGS